MPRKLSIYIEQIQIITNKKTNLKTKISTANDVSLDSEKNRKGKNKNEHYTEKIIKTEKHVILKDKAFADGGEGLIYQVIKSDYNNVVAKIFKDSTKALQMQPKIEYMVKNPAVSKRSPLKIQESVIWPMASLFDQNTFVGYLMPEATDTVDLSHFVVPDLSINIRNDARWQKFDRNNNSAYFFRVQIAINILLILQHLKTSGNLVIADLKPSNIRIDSSGNVYLLDLDSIQISENGKLLFHASAWTDQWAPPEKYRQDLFPSQSELNVHWDYFGFAVILYQLFFGLNPFTGSVIEGWGKFDEIVDLIKTGYFPKGKNASKFKRFPEHHPHNNFHKVSKEVQGLFLKCFDDGSLEPELRPGYDEWIKVLSDELTSGSALKTKISIQKTLISINNSDELIRLKNWWQLLNQDWLRIFRQELNIINTPSEKQFHHLIRLKKVICPSSGIHDVQPLEALTNLEEIIVSDTEVSSISPLQSLVYLRSLNISYTEVNNLEPLSHSFYLNTLKIYNSKVTSLNPLKNLGNLEWLYIDNTDVTSLMPLKDLKNLKILSCSNTVIKSLEPLKELTQLEQLNCAGTKIKGIDCLKNITNLNSLDIRKTTVSYFEIRAFKKYHPLCTVRFSFFYALLGVLKNIK